MSNVTDVLEDVRRYFQGKESPTTFKELQSMAMERARKAELDDRQAETMLRRLAKRYDIPLPKTMAPKQEKARGGMAKKAQMMRGGMANGKVHMYSAGGAVTDNAGLRALKASGPKGRAAYNKIVSS